MGSIILHNDGKKGILASLEIKGIKMVKEQVRQDGEWKDVYRFTDEETGNYIGTYYDF